jgi:hypothetical protein
MVIREKEKKRFDNRDSAYTTTYLIKNKIHTHTRLNIPHTHISIIFGIHNTSIFWF